MRNYAACVCVTPCHTPPSFCLRLTVLQGYGVDALSDGFMMVIGRSAAQSDWPQVPFPPLEGFGAARMHVAGLQVLVQPLSDRSVRCCYCCHIDIRAPLPRPMLRLATQHVVTTILTMTILTMTILTMAHAPPGDAARGGPHLPLLTIALLTMALLLTLTRWGASSTRCSKMLYFLWLYTLSLTLALTLTRWVASSTHCSRKLVRSAAAPSTRHTPHPNPNPNPKPNPNPNPNPNP